MAYTKTTWIDHVEDPITGEVYTAGTEVNAEHLNKMEAGIEAAHNLAADANVGTAAAKESIVNADSIIIVDSADENKTKHVLWSAAKTALAQLFASLTHSSRHASASATPGEDPLYGSDIKVSNNENSVNIEAQFVATNLELARVASVADTLDSSQGTANGIAVLDANVKVAAAQASAKTLTVTASCTLALTDAGKRLKVNSTSAVVITIPTHAAVAFPLDTEIEILRAGTGTVTIAAASGVTIKSPDNAKAIDIQNGFAAAYKDSANVWYLSGLLG